jgi:glycerol kinase
LVLAERECYHDSPKLPVVGDNGHMNLVIDQGGHSTRAALYETDGRRIGMSAVPVFDHRPREDWVETDPDVLVASVTESVRRVAAEAALDLRTVERAAMVTQRASVVCWDRSTGEALSPVLSWQDRRATRECDALRNRAYVVRTSTGMFLSPHYGGPKLRWCLDNLRPVREAAEAGRLLCGPLASFLAFRSLVERPIIAEPATAARTLLWNRSSLDWDGELLEWFGIDRDWLPGCGPNRGSHGTLVVDEARIPLEVLAGDQNAAAYACGDLSGDEAFVNLGTGAFVLRRYRDDPGLVPGLLTEVGFRDESGTDHLLEGTVNGASSALDWLERVQGARNTIAKLPRWLSLSDEPPVFLNGVSGLGAPYWKEDFPSRFIGQGSPGLKAVAVIESIVFLVRVNLEAMADAGPPIRTLRVGGGLSRLDGLCQRLADLGECVVERETDPESTSRGAAVLLADRSGTPTSPAPTDRFEPREDGDLFLRFVRWRGAMESEVSVRRV